MQSGKGWILLGVVQGSKREAYEVSIELDLTREGQVAHWDSLCEYPFGAQYEPEAPALPPPRSAAEIETERHATLVRAQPLSTGSDLVELLRPLSAG